MRAFDGVNWYFGFSFLWGVFVRARPRVDLALRDRDDALHRDAHYPLTVRERVWGGYAPPH
jgi:hypothetical protein